MTTTTGTHAILKASAIDAFKARLHGQLLSADDAGYDTARKVWNGMEVIETIVAHCTTKTSPMSAVALLPINGATARVDPYATAFVHRQPRYHLFLMSQWRDPAESDRHMRWTREFWAAMQRFAGVGVYVNELGYDEGEDRFRAAYGAKL